MEQLTLDIGVAVGPSLASFWAGPNRAALEHLRLWLGDAGAATLRSPVPTYLWGESGSGKTHLLKSVRAALSEQHASAGWLDPATAEPPEFDAQWAVMLLDDVQSYNAVQQHAAFNWFVNAQTHQRWVLAAGALPAADLGLREDLRTRLGWGHVFQLQVLEEDDRRIVLQSRALERGLRLSPEVLDFMLNRFSRDLSSLVELLDQLDRFSLRTRRAITVPLVRSMLEQA